LAMSDGKIDGKIEGDERSEPVTCAALTMHEATWQRAPVVAERAFAGAVREHQATLTAIARRLCGNAADADDLLHDTYERALRAWERYADHGNVRGWLVAILNNLFIDRCRRAKRARTEALDPVDVAAPEPTSPAVWTRVSNEQVAAALQYTKQFRQRAGLLFKCQMLEHVQAERPVE